MDSFCYFFRHGAVLVAPWAQRGAGRLKEVSGIMFFIWVWARAKVAAKVGWVL